MADGTIFAITEPTPPAEESQKGDNADVIPARTETQSTETDVDPVTAVALIADPRRIPDWASAFADTVTGDARSGWRVHKDDQSFALRVVTHAEAGTVDYLREVAPGREGGAFLRVVARPSGGSVIVMTVPVIPGRDRSETSSTLRAELRALARLLEHRGQ